MDISRARDLWEALEPIHASVYFTPEPKAEYETLGLEPISQYFASRSAPMGAVTHQVVAATFYNFSPGLVRRAMRDAWTTASPAEVVKARLTGVAALLERFHTVQSFETAEATALAGAACDVLTPEGRALYAGHADQPVPDHSMVALWHYLTLLREHRGDGHAISLAAHGFSGLDAILTSDGYSKLTLEQLTKMRGFRPEAWEAGVAALVDRGWLETKGVRTQEGTNVRESVEAMTDELAMAPLRHIGEERVMRLVELLVPINAAVEAGDGLPR